MRFNWRKTAPNQLSPEPGSAKFRYTASTGAKATKERHVPMLEEGAKAPDFTLPADDGTAVKLSKLKGQPVVLYFYPKDDTSGCTREAKDFSDLAPAFAKAGAAVYGISPDSVKSHDKFRCKHELTVRLLADEEKEVATAYGVWVEKSMYGKKYMGVERSTFLIDGKGKVVKVWRKVSVPGHADDVLAAVKALKS
jgi:peroxiredoxin Q/BCP